MIYRSSDQEMHTFRSFDELVDFCMREKKLISQEFILSYESRFFGHTFTLSQKIHSLQNFVNALEEESKNTPLIAVEFYQGHGTTFTLGEKFHRLMRYFFISPDKLYQMKYEGRVFDDKSPLEIEIIKKARGQYELDLHKFVDLGEDNEKKKLAEIPTEIFFAKQFSQRNGNLYPENPMRLTYLQGNLQAKVFGRTRNSAKSKTIAALHHFRPSLLESPWFGPY